MAKYISGLLPEFISLLLITLHCLVTRKTYSERRVALMKGTKNAIKFNALYIHYIPFVKIKMNSNQNYV